MSEDSRIEFRRIQGPIGDSSYAVYLPKRFVASLGIEKGTVVKISREGENIIIRKAEG